MIITPIWKDYYYTTTASTFYFSIQMDGKTIFNGKSVKFPGDDQLRINLSRICENYLNTQFPQAILYGSPTSGSYRDYDAAKEFRVIDEHDVNIATVYFVNDWSYQVISYDGSAGGETVVNRPINGKWTPGMWVFESYVDAGVFSLFTTYSKTGNTLYNIEACGDYAIYYRNRFGGWDSFLIENKVVRTDNYNQTSYQERVDAGRKEHSDTRYLNIITPTWECNTGWLSDSQSEILAKHLLPSNCIYLHDLTRNIIYPGVITNTSATYKTFKNEKKMVSYQITIKAANDETTK